MAKMKTDPRILDLILQYCSVLYGLYGASGNNKLYRTACTVLVKDYNSRNLGASYHWHSAEQLRALTRAALSFTSIYKSCAKFLRVFSSTTDLLQFSPRLRLRRDYTYQFLNPTTLIIASTCLIVSNSNSQLMNFWIMIAESKAVRQNSPGRLRSSLASPWS